MKSILLLTLASLMLTLANAQSCISPRGFNPDVCQFTPSSSFANDATQSLPDRCITANANPFDTFPPTGNANQRQDVCNAAIQADGADCIEAYAKFQCANRCSICNQDPCQSLCTALGAECPTATFQNCFQFALCATSNSNCVNWDVDLSGVSTSAPTSSTTSTSASTGTTTTTTSTASTTDTDTSAASSNGVAFGALVFIAAASLLL